MTDTNLTRELVILGASNYIGNGNTFIYNLGRNVEFKKNSSIMIQSLSMYNSTYNITSTFSNNILYISWLGTQIQIVIPDGYYSYAEINALIQYYLIQNNWYWTENNVAIYPISVSENSIRYKAQINISPIPSSSQSSGLVIPSGATWTFPATAETPQVTINSGLGKIFGFSSNLIFPPTVQSSTYSYISDITPIISPVYSYVLTCNLLNTNISPYNNNILGQIPINNSFGGLITYNSYTPSKINIHPSKYNQIIIQFLSQTLQPINIIDPEITLILEIEY